MTQNSTVARYLQTYSGKELLKKHSLTDVGLWRIRGEDPNCDFDGNHHQPDLGVTEGKLEDVVEYAVALKNFWTWGAGGDITAVKVVKIDSSEVRRIASLRKEAVELEARLKQIKSELAEE